METKILHDGAASFEVSVRGPDSSATSVLSGETPKDTRLCWTLWPPKGGSLSHHTLSGWLLRLKASG